jgi:hypothetical protein
MKRNRWAVVGVTIGGVFLLAALAWAVSSNGPYYALPAWDQKLPVSTRFVELLDWSSQAVLDRETGLVWEKAPTTTNQLWSNARFFCADKAVGGRKGWRLPSIAELASLIDPSVPSPGPTLPAGHPFTNVQSFFYWSASTNANSPTLASAWSVDFEHGDAEILNKTDTLNVWCVRGGMNADQY